jgi:hypothetical protein
VHLLVDVAQVSTSPASTTPLSDEHYQELADADLRARKVRRGIRVATFDGWTVGAFGALTLLFGVFSIAGWIMGAGMCMIAWIELDGAKRLGRFEPRSGIRLGWNQVALGSLLLCYAMFGLWRSLYGPDPLASTIESAPEVASMVSGFSEMARMIGAAVYALLAMVAIFAQGGTAWFYFTREKYLSAYRAQTPDWIVKLNERMPRAA